MYRLLSSFWPRAGAASRPSLPAAPRRRVLQRALAFSLALFAFIPAGNAFAFGAKPSVVTNAAGTQSVFYRTATGQLGMWTRNSSNGWTDGGQFGLADTVTGTPAAVLAANGDRYVYYRMANGQLGSWWISANGAAHNDTSYGLIGAVVGDPTAVIEPNGDRYVYYRTSNGQLAIWWISANGTDRNDTYAGDPNSIASSPSAVVAPNGDRYVYFRTPSGQLGSWWFSINGHDLNLTSWGGSVTGNPSATITPAGSKFVAYRYSNGQLGLWWFGADGTSWNPTQWGTVNSLAGDPSAKVSASGDLSVFYREPNGQIGAWQIFANGGYSQGDYGSANASFGEPATFLDSNGWRYALYASNTGQLAELRLAGSSIDTFGVGINGSLPAVDDRYSTSWNYGGSNGIVDTAVEADAVIALLRASGSDVAATSLAAGLAPADAAYVQQRAKVSAPSTQQFGGADLTVDSASEADAFITAFRNVSNTDSAALALYGGLRAADQSYVAARMSATLPNESLVRDVSSGQYWLIEDGSRLPFATSDAPDANGFVTSDALRVVTAAISGLPTGETITRDGDAEVFSGPTASAASIPPVNQNETQTGLDVIAPVPGKTSLKSLDGLVELDSLALVQWVRQGSKLSATRRGLIVKDQSPTYPAVPRVRALGDTKCMAAQVTWKYGFFKINSISISQQPSVDVSIGTASRSENWMFSCRKGNSGKPPYFDLDGIGYKRKWLKSVTVTVCSDLDGTVAGRRYCNDWTVNY